MTAKASVLRELRLKLPGDRRRRVSHDACTTKLKKSLFDAVRQYMQASRVDVLRFSEAKYDWLRILTSQK